MLCLTKQLNSSQICLKYIFVPRLKPLIDICDSLIEVHESNSKFTMKYYGLCHQYADLTSRMIKIVLFAYFIVIGLYTSPYIVAYFGPTRVIPCMSLIRGSGKMTAERFAMLLTYQYMILISCYLVLVAIDLLIIVVFVNLPMLTDIIIGQLRELNDVLAEGRESMQMIKQRLQQIIMMHNKYNLYVNWCR